ncbi:MAG: alkaline phosphatase family protein [Candidatus Omnitrophica bacterium]|nr:alkaline phosphatase family protein [Candidatus Omnitrophota bacterium]
MLDKTIFLGYIDPGSGFVITSLGVWVAAFFLGFLGIFSLFFKKILGFVRKYKKKIFFVLSIIIGLSIIGVIVMSSQESEFNKKVVILGFDGLSPRIIEPMMEQVRLPSFSALKERGSYGHISTTNPSQSPVAWAGFATGQNPGKNGIFDFIVRDPKTYGLDLSLSKIEKGKPIRVLKTKAFWQYTSEKKVPTVIIGCPVTFPPDKIYGRMLSGMGVPDILGTEGTFTFYTSESLDKSKDIGGKVFHVDKQKVMDMYLIGPKVAIAKGKPENVKVSFKATIQEDNRSIVIEYQGRKSRLKAGQWSNWQEVNFNLGFFKKAKGIFKFYLAEAEPEFKLYISPINFDPRSPFFEISYPKKYSKELADTLGLYYTQGMPMDTWVVNEKRLTEKAFLEQVNEVLKEKKAMLDFELKRLKKGVLFCYFESPDIIQHMFWRYTDPGHPLYEEDAPQEYKDMIQSWYIKMDSVLGQVMKGINEEDTLIVLSDHGFDTFRRSVHLNSWLRQNGYLALGDEYSEQGSELLMDVDWSKTKAYAIGFGAIYINQQNRELHGIVNPGAETEALKEEISAKLKGWVDEKYNKPIINKVYHRQEIFWGDNSDKTPDLYVGFNIGYRASWQTALGAVPGNLIEDNIKKWSGSHLFDPNLIPGIIFSNKHITKENPSLYDITPSILKIIGLSDQELNDCNFDGKSLF